MVICDHSLTPLCGQTALLRFSPKIKLAIIKVADAAAENWAKVSDLLILAENLADNAFSSRPTGHYDKVRRCRRPRSCGPCLQVSLAGDGLRDSTAPLLAGDHVTDDTGTGFVHTRARSRLRATLRFGRRMRACFKARAHLCWVIPYTVDENRCADRAGAGLQGGCAHYRQGREGRRQ